MNFRFWVTYKLSTGEYRAAAISLLQLLVLQQRFPTDIVDVEYDTYYYDED